MRLCETYCAAFSDFHFEMEGCAGAGVGSDVRTRCQSWGWENTACFAMCCAPRRAGLLRSVWRWFVSEEPWPASRTGWDCVINEIMLQWLRGEKRAAHTLFLNEGKCPKWGLLIRKEPSFNFIIQLIMHFKAVMLYTMVFAGFKLQNRKKDCFPPNWIASLLRKNENGGNELEKTCTLWSWISSLKWVWLGIKPKYFVVPTEMCP